MDYKMNPCADITPRNAFVRPGNAFNLELICLPNGVPPSINYEVGNLCLILYLLSILPVYETGKV